jgi:hypothetical protein
MNLIVEKFYNFLFRVLEFLFTHIQWIYDFFRRRNEYPKELRELMFVFGSVIKRCETVVEEKKIGSFYIFFKRDPENSTSIQILKNEMLEIELLISDKIVFSFKEGGIFCEWLNNCVAKLGGNNLSIESILREKIEGIFSDYRIEIPEDKDFYTNVIVTNEKIDVFDYFEEKFPSTRVTNCATGRKNFLV